MCGVFTKFQSLALNNLLSDQNNNAAEEVCARSHSEHIC